MWSERSAQPAALAKILAELFKGEEEEFLHHNRRDGYSMYNPPIWVSPNPFAFIHSALIAILDEFPLRLF